jgi:hypothetical protein
VQSKETQLNFLMETKVRQKKMEKIRSKLGFRNCFTVDCIGRSEGLALLWREDLELEIQNYSRRHINVIVTPRRGGERWKMTGFYRNLEPHKRHESWALLHHLAGLNPKPWVCFRDFNEVTDRGEKKGGLERSVGQMDAFRSALSFCELSDLGCNGAHFTWNNGQEGSNFIQARLDRVVANAEWCASFPEVSIVTEAVLNSDHLPILFTSGGTGRHGGWRKQFKYEAHWAKEKGVKEVVKKVWRKKFNYEDKWQNMKEKLEVCSKGLLRWRRKNRGESKNALKEKTQQLEFLQRERAEPEMERIRGLQKELQDLLEKEEIKWKQKSKKAWLKEGDKNTKYFSRLCDPKKIQKCHLQYYGRAGTGMGG